MNRLRHILVGWDFSPGAHSAFSQAARLAGATHSHLTLLHVIDREEIDTIALAANQPRALVEATAIQTAQAAIGKILTGAGITATARVIIGAPLHELLLAAITLPADLLVIGARGHPGPDPAAGSLAAKLIRKCPTKVMLVQPGQVGRFRNIVACVDFSPTSAEAVKQAMLVAQKDGGKVHCLHVFEPPWHDLQHRMPSLAIGAELQDRFQTSMRLRLQEFITATGAASAQASLHSAEHHSYGIVEFAQRSGADLIVLGTHGRSHLEYMLLGSTAEGLLRHLGCSVLTIRATDAPNIFGLSRKSREPGTVYQ